ncbi:MAG: hypothetical protein HYW95_02630 [Candidatus Wildermuthbacteria bacterium]|nr:hypothetical protein [Candidatus Wildermuthbacteria bacterium]
MKNVLLIIDSNSLIHRAYHALPPLSTQKGELINAVYGFLQIFLRLLKEFHPQSIAATFDLDGPTIRYQKFQAYKATRHKAPDELYRQIPYVRDVLKVLQIPIYEKQGFEADDAIGTIVRQATEQYPSLEIIIASGDLDTLQLVSDRVRVYTLRKGMGDTVLYDKEGVAKRFGGLSPSQLPDYKGLCGDASDNIPGVNGIGEKTAIQLLQRFGSIEELYASLEREDEKAQAISPGIRTKLLKGREQGLFSKELGTIEKAVPISFVLQQFSFENLFKPQVAQMFRELEFQKLFQRIQELKEEKRDARQKETYASLYEAEEQISQMYREGILSSRTFCLEKKLLPVLKGAEEIGMKIDVPYFQRLSSEAAKEIEEFQKTIYQIAGKEFNMNSPQQLSKVLFEDLQLSPKGLRKTPGRVISTAAPELEKLRHVHPIIERLLEYRELQKIFTTYIKTLPLLADSNSRVHTHFHQLGTATGRISSSEPNLQNIPIQGVWGTKIRKGFIAEQGWKFVSFDYSQMELRLVAHISKDQNMQEIFAQGADIHRTTAAEVFGIPLEQVTNEMRYKAKALNFGVLYGMGANGFARAAGISLEEAEEFIENYFLQFPGIREYVEHTKEFARTHGYVETLWGRKRFLPDINSRVPHLRFAAERMAINHPIQGTAADVMKEAMARAWESICGSQAGSCRMLLQIHDELLFELKDDIITQITPDIRRIMERVETFAVPLLVEMKIGINWGEMQKYLS